MKNSSKAARNALAAALAVAGATAIAFALAAPAAQATPNFGFNPETTGTNEFVSFNVFNGTEKKVPFSIPTIFNPNEGPTTGHTS